MKSFTDIEQSKQLVEILPIESADMCYIKHSMSNDNTWKYEGMPPMVLCDVPLNEITVEHLPCWSLAALLGVIPKRIDESNVLRMDIDDNDFAIWYDEMGGTTNFGVNDKLPDITLKEPVDACVEMLFKLHEQKLL